MLKLMSPWNSQIVSCDARLGTGTTSLLRTKYETERRLVC